MLGDRPGDRGARRGGLIAPVPLWEALFAVLWLLFKELRHEL